MLTYIQIITDVIRKHWGLFILISIGFPIIYYVGLLVLTMLRFGEIPNYAVFHDIFHIYRLILQGTPSLSDALLIMLDEAWFETGYKNPEYYGVATWSFMLIPPKMLLVFLMGLLLGFFVVLLVSARKLACPVNSEKKLYAAASMSSAFVCLTSATLTWVVCCATPSWVVALSMLGMSASLALWIEPLGKILMITGLGIMFAIIIFQVRQLAQVRLGGTVSWHDIGNRKI